MLFGKQNSASHLLYYVVDEKGWVQHKRIEHLMQYQTLYRLKPLSAGRFKLLWKLGLLRKKHIFLSSWRTAHALLKADPVFFNESDFQYLMAAVTSHSNIGGGLDPLRPCSGRTPEEAYRLATDLLKRFKVVTANSMLLHDLLSPAVPNLLYCPNGVDTEFYTPDTDKTYDPGAIRIGWVGKKRGAKNHETIEKACSDLVSRGGFKTTILKVKKSIRSAPYSADQMREFYRSIDFYLCASWNEGTPNPALEAGACGVPVVTTRVGNMPELIKPGINGYFIEPTAASIVNQFETLKKLTVDEYMRLRRNMRNAVVKEWSWEVRIKNFTHAMEKLVS